MKKLTFQQMFETIEKSGCTFLITIVCKQLYESKAKSTYKRR